MKNEKTGRRHGIGLAARIEAPARRAPRSRRRRTARQAVALASLCILAACAPTTTTSLITAHGNLPGDPIQPVGVVALDSSTFYYADDGYDLSNEGRGVYAMDLDEDPSIVFMSEGGFRELEIAGNDVVTILGAQLLQLAFNVPPAPLSSSTQTFADVCAVDDDIYLLTGLSSLSSNPDQYVMGVVSSTNPFVEILSFPDGYQGTGFVTDDAETFYVCGWRRVTPILTESVVFRATVGGELETLATFGQHVTTVWPPPPEYIQLVDIDLMGQGVVVASQMWPATISETRPYQASRLYHVGFDGTVQELDVETSDGRLDIQQISVIGDDVIIADSGETTHLAGAVTTGRLFRVTVSNLP